MIAATIDVPRRDMRRLVGQIERAQKELGRSMEDAVSWGGRIVGGSLSASTRIAPKLRKIVKNPDSRAKTDKRRAKFGVNVFNKAGNKVFLPIYRGGEFGAKLRFTGRHTTEFASRDSGGLDWMQMDARDEIEPGSVSTIGRHKKRNIQNRGLAKKAWRAATARIKTDGPRSAMGVRNIASVQWRGRRSDNVSLTLSSNLRYASVAWNKQGGSGHAVNTALARGAANMERRISLAIAKRLKG